MKKLICSSLAVLFSGGAAYAAVSWGLAPETSPLAKFFLIFFGGIVVLQIIPAAVLFSCLIRGMFKRSDVEAEQLLAVESQSK